MSEPFFFGYGSLVNRATHHYADAHPARARGWRRVWRHTDLRPVAFLTAVEDAASQIEGLMAHVPGGDWDALDMREHAYDRVIATQDVHHPVDRAVEIAIYHVPDGKHGPATEAHPILLSYIDVVVQGYLREFGPEGAKGFFATTGGWDAPVMNDRRNPIYSRHQRLSDDETAFVDRMLGQLPVRMIDDDLALASLLEQLK